MDFELVVNEIEELQEKVALRTSAEQRVECLISEGKIEEALRLLSTFEKEGTL